MQSYHSLKTSLDLGLSQGQDGLQSSVYIFRVPSCVAAQNCHEIDQWHSFLEQVVQPRPDCLGKGFHKAKENPNSDEERKKKIFGRGETLSRCDQILGTDVRK